MDKKNGFTLIELLAVITILTILSLIIIPIIDTNVKKAKNNMYIIQIENIRNAGRNYFSDNSSIYLAGEEYGFVTLSTLIEKGYISQLDNPKTGSPFDSNIYVQFYNNNGNYRYSVCPIENGCQSFQ